MKRLIFILFMFTVIKCYGVTVTDKDGKKEITKQGKITITVLKTPSVDYIKKVMKPIQQENQKRIDKQNIEKIIQKKMRELAIEKAKAEGLIPLDFVDK